MPLFFGSTKVALNMGDRIGENATNQSKSVTPTQSTQTVTPDPGYTGLSQVTVNAIPNSYLIPSGTSSITSNGTYPIGNYASVNVNVQPSLQNKSITPTKSIQVLRADTGYYGLSQITVDSIPASYIIPSSTYTVSSAGSNIDITSYANLNVPSGSVQTLATAFTSSQGLISFYYSIYSGFVNSGGPYHIDRTFPTTSISTITPTTSSQIAVSQYNWTLNDVVVEPIPSAYIIPSGTYTVTSAGAFNIKQFASLSVPEVEINPSNITFSMISSTGRVCASVSANVAGWYRTGAYIGNNIILSTTSISQIVPSASSQIAVPQYTWTLNDVVVEAIPSSYVTSMYKRLYERDYPPQSEYEAFIATTSMIPSLYFAITTVPYTQLSIDNITQIGGRAFYSCYYFRSINCPSVTLIDASAFTYCHDLSSISFPNVISIGYDAFLNCNELSGSLNFPVLQSVGQSAFYGCKKVTNLNVPQVTYFGYNAFYLCSTLSTINCPNLEYIGSSCFGYAGIQDINCPKVSSIGMNAFYFCSNLTTASFPSISIVPSSCFLGCSNLTTVNVLNADTIGSYAFSGCYKLSDITMPNVVTISNWAFFNCSSLSILSLSKVTTISTYAFASCINLTTIDCPLLTTVSTSAFANCSNLTTVSLPNLETAIALFIFEKCINLSSISLPKITRIGQGMFRSCYNLTTARFSMATSVGMSAFDYCSKLESLYLLGSSVASLGGTGFVSTPFRDSTYLGYFGSIYVPSSLLTSYQTTIGWSNFSDRFVGI